MLFRSATRTSFAATAVLAAAVFSFGGLLADLADARPGSSGSSGSRGTRTFTPPAATQTAPGAAAPIQRSITQPGAITKAPAAATAATAAAATAAKPSMMRNLLLGGLMGAGLAMMFGSGPMAGILGFILQTLLIAGVVYLAVMFFRNRFGAKPAIATAAAAPSARPAQPNVNLRQASMAGSGAAAAPALKLSDADFSAFEGILTGIQTAYGQGDLDALGRRATPEMLSYFAHELDDNRRKGVVNEISAPKLLQGDLSESWREAGSEFATVAMRYSLTDATVEAKTGRVVSGNRTVPQEVTEIWTFRRNPGQGPDGWELSAIQQTV